MSATSGRRTAALAVLSIAALAALCAVAPAGRAASASAPSPPATSATYIPPVGEDLSGLSWTAAFARLQAKISLEYAFTPWKHIDWPAMYRTYAPRIARAEAAGDQDAYYLALRQYIHQLRDGHADIAAATPEAQALMTATVQSRAGGGFGVIVTKLDGGSVIASWIKPGGPTAKAGMTAGARILAWGGLPVDQALARTSTALGPSQPTDVRVRHERLRFLVRAPVGVARTVTFRNRGAAARTTARLVAVDDGQETLTMTDARSVLNTGWPQKLVEHSFLPGNVGYLRIYLEMDLPASLPGDHTPTLQLFRQAMDELIDAHVAGVIVDVRSNSGGSDQMVADMMGSFYDRRTLYEYASFVDPATGAFSIWREDDVTSQFVPGEGIWIEPGVKRYAGPVVALVNNGCISSGEGVAMGIRNLANGKVVGFEGTNGSFGMAGDVVLMPGDFEVKWPYGRSLDEHMVVQLDSRHGRGGVQPDVRVPRTRTNVLRQARGRDVVLEYGLRVLARM